MLIGLDLFDLENHVKLFILINLLWVLLIILLAKPPHVRDWSSDSSFRPPTRVHRRKRLKKNRLSNYSSISIGLSCQKTSAPSVLCFGDNPSQPTIVANG